AGGTPKPHRRFANDAPTGGVDLDRLPFVVREIEVERIAVGCDAHVDRSLVAAELRRRLEHTDRGLQRLAVWSAAAGCFIEPMSQPPLERFRPNLPSLTMPAHLYIGITDAVRGLEEWCPFLRDVDQNIGLLRLLVVFGISLIVGLHFLVS